ncbi:MAG TPA: methyltransferase domain-containing protein [Phnomibacter sp.]|nr:methyltransferase domain-containing protein [Phnomibacter sp.]
MKLAEKVSAFNRERKWQYFKTNLPFNSETKILDVGFNNKENSSVDNYLEKKYPFQQNITALGIGGKDFFEKKYPKVKVVLYDGKTFPFHDKTFDICWSNAVIEHVGDFENQLLFIKEMLRVSKQVIFTTPNKNFPVEVHTRTPLLHLLPKAVFEKYLFLVGKKWACGSYMNLLTKRDIIKLLKRAGASNFKISSNKILGFSLDYVIIISP